MTRMVILAVAVVIRTAAVIALLLSPAFFATRDWSGAVDVTAVRGTEGVRETESCRGPWSCCSRRDVKRRAP